MHIAVVGGSLAGLRSAEQLRAAGYADAITVLGSETHLPYNRPPLSKELLADPGDHDEQRLHGLVEFRRRGSVGDVDFRLGATVVSADLDACSVTLESGAVREYDGLVVATGLRSRRLPLSGPEAGRHALRTLDDCRALRAALGPRPTVVVIGAGFIGCEVAATLTSLGARVTVVDPLGPPMVRVIGERLARAIQRHHEAAGIAFRTDAGVLAYTGDDRVTGVELTDGSTLAADLVVEAVGSIPNTEWLGGNGLDLDDGVLTTNHLAAIRPGPAPPVVAAGDIARFPNPLFDDIPRRVEHWSMPTDTAKRAARTLVAALQGAEPDPAPFCPVPSFWSDQLDLRLQSFGSPQLADTVEFTGGDPDRLLDGVSATYTRAGRLVGLLAVNLPPQEYRGMRAAIADLAPG